MKKSLKILSLILCMAMLLSSFVVTAFASDEAQMLTTSGDIGNQVHWIYDSETGTLTISKPEGFTGKWSQGNWACNTTITLGDKKYKVACPWGKCKFNSEPDANTEDTYSATYVDYSHIKKVVIEEGVTSVPSYAFYSNSNEISGTKTHTNLTELVLPTTLKSIGIYAFNYAGITTVDFSQTSLEEIGSNAFEECPITGSVVMPKTIKNLGGTAFCNYSTQNSTGAKMTSFIIPSKAQVTSLYRTFDGQKNLEFVVLPESIETISSYAFRDCPKVNVVCLGNAPSFGTTSGVFNKNAKVYYSDKATGWTADDITNVSSLNSENIIKLSGLPTQFTECGKVGSKNTFWFYNKDNKTLDICGKDSAGWAYDSRPWPKSIGDEVENVNINDGVVVNGELFMFSLWGDTDEKKEKAFSHPNVKTMYLGSDVKKLGNFFMSGSAGKLEKLTFSPNSQLTVIGSHAFTDHHLTELILPDTVETIDSQAFDMNGTTDKSLQKLYLGKSLKTVGSYAFRHCKNLESVVFPATLESIGTSAFQGTDNASGLKAIVFLGTAPVMETTTTANGNQATVPFANNYKAKVFTTDVNKTNIESGLRMSDFTTAPTIVLDSSLVYTDMKFENDTATANVYDFSGKNKQFSLYTAKYDTDGLAEAAVDSTNVAANNKFAVVDTLTTTLSGATRAFLWDSDLTPYNSIQN